MGNHSPSEIMYSWKSYIALQVKCLLKRIGKPLWQKEYQDNLICDDLEKCVLYTEHNLVKVRLCLKLEDWLWRSACFHQNEGMMPALPQRML